MAGGTVRVEVQKHRSYISVRLGPVLGLFPRRWRDLTLGTTHPDLGWSYLELRALDDGFHDIEPKLREG